MTEPSLNILTGNADAFCTDKNQLIKSIVPIVMEYGLYDPFSITRRMVLYLKVSHPGVILTDVGNTAKEQERRLLE